MSILSSFIFLLIGLIVLIGSYYFIHPGIALGAACLLWGRTTATWIDG